MKGRPYKELMERAQKAALKNADLRILDRLALLARQDGTFKYPGFSDRDLMRLTYVSADTLRVARNRLEPAGFIRVERGNGRTKSRYSLIIEGPRNQGPDHAQEGASSGPRPRDLPGLPPDDAGSYTRARSVSDGQLTAAAACSGPNGPRPRRGRRVLTGPLGDLADELQRRGLRASCDLSDDQLAELADQLAICGQAALVSWAYRAHKPHDPAHYWSAWWSGWMGLRPPPARSTAPPERPRETGGIPARPEFVHQLRQDLRRTGTDP